MTDLQKKKYRASAIVLGHNQSHCIEKAIYSVLNQNFDGLEVILSDNGSKDSTFDIMTSIAKSYKGPHKIILNRNIEDIGFIGHLNQLFNLASGSFIFYNPGDDVSIQGRFKKIWEEYKRTNALLVHSDVMMVDLDGKELGIKSSSAKNLKDFSIYKVSQAFDLCIGATCGWDKDIFNFFGSISEPDTYDDLILYFRATLAGNKIGYIKEPLMYYTVGSGMTNTKAINDIEILNKLARNAKIQIGTLKQRLKDCNKLKPTYYRIKLLLKFRIYFAMGIDKFYNGATFISILKTLNPITYFGYFWAKNQLKKFNIPPVGKS